MRIQQGVDISDVRRMEMACKRNGKRFLNRVFTSAEQAYCETKRMKYEHYAARFAAKEAVMKAIEIKGENRYRFKEIEIKRQPTGKPFVYFSPKAKKHFKLPKRFQMELSMAHEREFAIATVLMIVRDN